ncbi:ABC-2 type transport system permease protein [Azotobacter vinelandii CA]|uniref:ABC-2 type transport system permease protein n=2 Tax=Azotobacter vinelandii TaxID=354 RepID=C1DFZ8_AZOVD|nr:ABC transporter permease [Azotobacter vinelandii]ACO76325.1 ABC-2 type transport system permease protein [Azotobacter vinelandii DJ]AGK17453.1 ABC-2 type transport system permease protein [Azotobacter vinelandii CA]AGK19039.1 ABC-2 type transport system permease protein [Azotobacter vinelandii CA6]SFX30192.1 ABC-2 type transport system permease protein [Azotobacter vinelandii]GLK59392.1 transport permease protein [Azotobacter vinelandii]
MIDYLYRLANLCRKEFLAVLKDPANRVILIAPVILQTLLFGYGATFDLNDVPYAVLDQSRGELSMRLLARLDGTGRFHRVATLHSPARIADLIDAGDALLVLHFAADFDSRLSSRGSAPLQVLLDGRNSTTAGNAAAQIREVVANFNATLPGVASPPVTLETRAWFNPNLETRWNILPGLIASLSMIQVMMLAALSVAREREQGTFDQLLVTPVSPSQIMIGKALPAIVIGLLQSALVMLISIHWFDVPMAGAWPALAVGLLVFTVAVVGVGLSISALSANMQQAMLYTFVLLVPLVLLSGLATPVRNMPEAFQIATHANPLRFAIDLVRRVYLEGAPLEQVWRDFIPMVCVAALTLPLAAWLFRNRLA